MSLIGSIVLDDINDPCDLATALRLLLVDHLDRNEYGIENPDPVYAQDGELNYRFYGDETSFVLGFETGRGALRVDVRRAEDDEPTSAAEPVDASVDAAERNYLESLIERLGLPKVIAAVGNRHAADLDGKPGITAKEWSLIDTCVNTLGSDEALARLALAGRTGDETRLIAAFRALGISLGTALRRLEDESGEEPAETPARCCDGECRFSWRKLFGVSRSSPSPTTRTPDQVEPEAASEVNEEQLADSANSSLSEIRDPVLARLIDEFHAAEDEEGHLAREAKVANDRFDAAANAMFNHFISTHAKRKPDGSLIGYHEFVYRGRLYRVDEEDDPSYLVSTDLHVLTV